MITPGDLVLHMKTYPGAFQLPFDPVHGRILEVFPVATSHKKYGIVGPDMLSVWVRLRQRLYENLDWACLRVTDGVLSIECADGCEVFPESYTVAQ